MFHLLVIVYAGCLMVMLVLMASFQDSLGKPVPDCRTILDFAAATDDAGGSGNI